MSSVRRYVGKTVPYWIIRAGRIFINFGTSKCEVCHAWIRRNRDSGYGYSILEKLQVVGGYRRRNDACPVCHAGSRERLIWLYLTYIFFPGLDSDEVRVVHFAPEKGLSARLVEKSSIHYRAYDIEPERYRHLKKVARQDLHHLSLKTESVDLLIGNHILEHVQDLPRALAEVRRVMKPGALAIMQVPIALRLEHTISASGDEDDAERITKFGQSDHVRLFSAKGYECSLAEGGFRVDRFNPFDWNADVSTKWELDPFECLYLIRRSQS